MPGIVLHCVWASSYFIPQLAEGTCYVADKDISKGPRTSPNTTLGTLSAWPALTHVILTPAVKQLLLVACFVDEETKHRVVK